MLMYSRLLLICLLPFYLSGCAGLTKYIENLQKQSVDDFDQRSAYFKPQYQFEPPSRARLTPEEQRLVGAPPPQQGEVVLDGIRYYSANGHVCQYFKTDRRRIDSKSACWIKGQWVLAAPVLNTESVTQ